MQALPRHSGTMWERVPTLALFFHTVSSLCNNCACVGVRIILMAVAAVLASHCLAVRREGSVGKEKRGPASLAWHVRCPIVDTFGIYYEVTTDEKYY